MNKKIKKLVVFSLFLALEIIFCFSPLGSINLFGPIVATLAMIPVSLITLLLGLKAGLFLGFFMGLFSLIVWTFTPPLPIAFIFSPFVSSSGISGNFNSLLICFVPRIMIAVITFYSYKISNKFINNKTFSGLIAGFLGSLFHSFLVLLGIYLFFKDSYSLLIGMSIWTIFGSIILTNAIPEAIINGLSAMVFVRSFIRK